MRILGTMIALTVLPITLPSQTDRPVREDCGTCMLATRRVFSIRDDSGVLRNVAATRVVETANRGLIVFQNPGSADPPVIYDSTGARVGPLGGRGVGPGETSQTSWIEIGTDGSVRVFSGGRVNEFSSRGAPTRSGAYQGPMSRARPVFLPSGVSVWKPMWTAAGQTQHPLHVLNADGSPKGKIVVSPTGLQIPSYVLGPARREDAAAERFWLAERDGVDGVGYSAWLVSTEGRGIERLTHNPKWWPRHTSATPVVLRALWPTPADVREYENGRLLVLMSRARPDLTSAEIATATMQRAILDFRQTAAIVIDRRGGRLLGMATANGYPVALLASGRFVTYAEDADGNPRLDVWEIRVP